MIFMHIVSINLRSITKFLVIIGVSGENGRRHCSPGKNCKYERARRSKEQSPLLWWIGSASKVSTIPVIRKDFTFPSINKKFTNILFLVVSVLFTMKVVKLKQPNTYSQLQLIILPTRNTWINARTTMIN